MSSDPAITVVIPVWGPHASYVGDAARSVLAQRGGRPRVLLVDNASDEPVPTPAGAEVLRLGTRLPIGGARNAGLAQASTPYVLFWDADDLMLPGALRRMREVLDADPRAVAVTMDSRRWSPQTGAGTRWPWPRAAMYRLCRVPKLLSLVALFVNPFTTTGPSLMRTESVRDAGGFHPTIRYLEDWVLALTLPLRGNVVMLRDVGRLYRVHEESLSSDLLDHPDQQAWFAAIRRSAALDPRAPWWLRAAVPLAHLAHKRRFTRRRRRGAGAGQYAAELRGTLTHTHGGTTT